MSFMAIAAVGGAVSSGLSSRRARKDARGAYDQAAYAQQQTINKLDEFAPMVDKFASLGQEQYDKYQDMFGPMEEKLNDYYMGLNPDELAAGGNQTAQQQYQQSMNQVNDQMAAQGMTGSGMQTQMAHQGANQMAQTKAQNIVNAPHQVAEAQSGWMNYGAGKQDQATNFMSQGMQAQGNLANAYGSAHSGQVGQFTQQGNVNMNLAQQGAQSMGKSLGASAYFGSQDGAWDWLK